MKNCSNYVVDDGSQPVSYQINRLLPTTDEELRNIMKLCPSKTCSMDACLTERLKRTLHIHIPYLVAMENKHNYAMMFVMLDLLAAFNTIDHAHLLTLLQDENGVHETALARFRTYKEDHTYRAQIDSTN